MGSQPIEFPAKWLAVLVIVLALAMVGKAGGRTFSPTNPAPPLEIANIFPDPVASDDLSAWVLEAKEADVILPTAPARAPFSSTSPSVANRNSNPLNIKLGSETQRYVDVGLAAISDIMPKDGGRFLRFDAAETGFRAAIALLNRPPYSDLNLDRALRKWSNNGFGTAILEGTRLDREKAVPHLDRNDLRILLNAMAAAEGYKSSTISEEISKAFE